MRHLSYKTMKNKESSTLWNWNCIISATVIYVVLTLLVIYVPDLTSFDKNILNSVQKLFTPYPEFIPFILNEIGKNHYVWPLIVSGSVLISHKMYLKTFLLIFFTELSEVATEFIKDIICRVRPCGDSYPGYSFPSGHSVCAMCFFGILIYLAIRHTSGFWRYFLISFFGLLIILAGLSRLWLGVHFPIDVISGMLLGFILVNLYIILCKAFNV